MQRLQQQESVAKQPNEKDYVFQTFRAYSSSVTRGNETRTRQSITGFGINGLILVLCCDGLLGTWCWTSLGWDSLWRHFSICWVFSKVEGRILSLTRLAFCFTWRQNDGTGSFGLGLMKKTIQVADFEEKCNDDDHHDYGACTSNKGCNGWRSRGGRSLISHLGLSWALCEMAECV